MRVRSMVCCALALLVAVSTAQAAYTVIVESRVSGGAQNSAFTFNGLATTSAKSTAAGLSGTGSYYAGQTTPSKWGQWSFTPAAGGTGYYDVFATWANNIYTSGMQAPTWTVQNAGTDVTKTLSQGTGGNAWNLLAGGLTYNAGVAKTVRLATTPDSLSNKRTYFDSVKFAPSTPGDATDTSGLPAEVPMSGATLSWAGGQYSNSFFDVYLDTTTTPTNKIVDNGAVTSVGTGSLLADTTYYWTVVSKNLDATKSTQFSFTTTPEPATMVFLALGGLLLRRRRA